MPTHNLNNILSSIYTSNVIVQESYSKYDSNIILFPTKNSLESYIEKEQINGNNFIYLAIYYPDTDGFIYKEKINLKPEKCNGSTYRYSIQGWGIIYLQLNFKNTHLVQAKFTVNSKKRANAWANTNSELKLPNLWNWSLVEKHTRRLKRILTKSI